MVTDLLDRLYTAVIFSDINPLDIATNAEPGGKVTIHAEGEQSFVEVFQMGELYRVLRRDGLIWSAIVVVALLATMFFVRDSRKLAERKDDIMHKLLIAFLIASCLFVTSAVVNLFDTYF